MFPCSSIYHNFSLPNQTLGINDHENNSTTFQIDDYYDHQNPITISSNHDQHYHHHQQEQNVPSLFEDDGVILSHLLSQQQLLSSNIVGYSQAVVSDHDPTARVCDDHHKQRKKSVPRKRSTGKKDRHSKISTAQGMRDRRMRLSLQIARRFFDLQDMLGFDKASRTIEWLFTKSKTAIKELKDSFLQSSTSEIGARIMEKLSPENDDEECEFATSVPNKNTKKMRKIHKVVARESRDNARARARERTREKMLEKTRQVSQSTDTSITISEEVKGEEEITCHSDLKMAALRFDQAELINQLQLDYSSFNGTSSEEDGLGFCESWDAQNPSLLFMSITSSNAQNPSSVLMAKNPNLIFGVPSSGNLEIDHREQNSNSDLLAGSNIYCSLNF